MHAKLGPYEVHIWLAQPDITDNNAALSEFWNIMSRQERERENRFYHHSDRIIHRIARGLTRNVLSMYAPVPPNAWIFTETTNGKPEISQPAEYNRLKFNISHTAGLVACAVTRERQIGVDVESPAREVDVEKIAKRFFAPEEFIELLGLPPAKRKERFFAYWTLKESYVKAKGTGLSLSTSRFAFALRETTAGTPLVAGVRFDPELKDNPDEWQFMLSRNRTGHFLAVSGREKNRRLVMRVNELSSRREIQPLAHEA